MAEMTEDEQLKEVKNSLGVTGNYQDARLLGYLRAVSYTHLTLPTTSRV